MTTSTQQVELELPETKHPTTRTTPTRLKTTKDLLQLQKLKLALLELFDQWDANNDEVLTTLEIIYGLRTQGFILNADTLHHAIKHVADKTKDALWGDDDLSHGNHFVDNEGFIDVMMHILNVQQHDGLASDNKEAMTTTKALKVIALLKQSLASDPLLGQRMQELKQKQSELVDKVRGGKYDPVKPSRSLARNSSLNSAVDTNNCNQCYQNFHKQWYTLPTIAIIFWLLIPTVLYVLVNQWGFNEAFYYSIQSGLSVGFGSLSEEKISGKNTFDICSPGTNATQLIELILDQQSVHGTTGELCAYQYVPNQLYLVSMFYTVVHICVGASFIGGVLSLFTVMAVESSEAWYKDGEETGKKELKEHRRKSGVEAKKELANKRRRQSGLEPLPDPVPVDNQGDNAKQGTDISKWFDAHRSEIKAVSILVAWVIVGTIVFALLEDVHWIKGLYFAVAACSTAGLAGPSSSNAASILFVGLYTLFGVPIYAYTLGIFSNVVTANYISNKASAQRQEAISQEEFNAANRLGDPKVGPEDGSIDTYEFALVWFLRNGKIEPDDIKNMQQDFDELDADDNGRFDGCEMQAALKFAQFDINGDRELSVNELVELADDLQRTKCMSVPGLYMLPPGKEYDVKCIQKEMETFEKSSTPKTDVSQEIVFDRSQFMRWFMKEFNFYRDQKGDGLPQGEVMRRVMLDEVISYFKNSEEDEVEKKNGKEKAGE
jgi:hypothetical protein